MDENDTITTEYQQYLAQRHGGAHERRTAENNAAFFLPHLTPGMRLLDAGCGPGSITLGLAQRVAPSEAVGIDISADRIDGAHALAKERGAENVRFETADVYAVPFEEASFDAAFSNALFQHLADPLAAMRELRRVLKPGAVIGVADADLGTAVAYPASSLLDRATEITVHLRDADGGTPLAGRRLRALLHEAGFTRIEATLVPVYAGNDAQVHFTAERQASFFEQPAVIARLIQLTLSDEAEMRAIASAWRKWGAAPGALYAGWGSTCIAWVGAGT